jgi:hypothetical protein
MFKGLSIALLIGGVTSILVGINGGRAAEAVRVLGGSPEGRALWMMLGGAVAALLGLFGSSDPGR